MNIMALIYFLSSLYRYQKEGIPAGSTIAGIQEFIAKKGTPDQVALMQEISILGIS